MLATLLLTACLSDRPDPFSHCETVELQYRGGPVGAMLAMAEWVEEHEGWMVVKWEMRR